MNRSVEQGTVTREPLRREIVVLVGMHRSGTSLCSHVLGLLGVDMTDDIGADRRNLYGHYERLQIVEIQDEILAMFDRGYFSPEHDFPLPPGWWADIRLKPIKERIKAVLQPIRARGGLFGFKDPRTARLLPMWNQIFAELDLQPRYVVCLRDPAHVAASLQARDGLDPSVGELRTLDYLVDALRYTQGRDTCFIRYRDWMPDPLPNARRLVDFLGLEGRLDDIDLELALRTVVRPELNRSGLQHPGSRQACVRSFFDLVDRYAQSQGTNDASKDDIRTFTNNYIAFRQVLLPFEADRKAKSDLLSNVSGSLVEAEQQREQNRERAEHAERRWSESLAQADALTAALDEARAQAAEAEAVASRRLGDLLEELRAERAESARLREAQERLRREGDAVAVAEGEPAPDP